MKVTNLNLNNEDVVVQGSYTNEIPQTIQERQKKLNQDINHLDGYVLGQTTFKEFIAHGWNAQNIPLGAIGIYGFIANRKHLGILLAYSKGFIENPEHTLAESVENKFQMRINDYIQNLTPNAEWIYNYNKFGNGSHNLCSVYDMIFHEGILIEKARMVY